MNDLSEALTKAICVYLRSPEVIQRVRSSVSAYYDSFRDGDFLDDKYAELIIDDLCVFLEAQHDQP